MSFLDDNGLAYLWQKIKAGFAVKSHTHGMATPTSDGFMSASDKAKLDLVSGDVSEGTYIYKDGNGVYLESYGKVLNIGEDENGIYVEV